MLRQGLLARVLRHRASCTPMPLAALHTKPLSSSPLQVGYGPELQCTLLELRQEGPPPAAAAVAAGAPRLCRFLLAVPDLAATAERLKVRWWGLCWGVVQQMHLPCNPLAGGTS